MADATDLKSVIYMVCGFESRSGHQLKIKELRQNNRNSLLFCPVFAFELKLLYDF